MKQQILLLIFVFSIFQAIGQEKPTVLSTDMFESNQQIYLSPLDGWLFKKGNDSAWAQPNIDVSDWDEMSLLDINPSLADESGRIEGWYRIEILLDSSFINIPLGISRQLWAATDIFLDGELIESFGNTANTYQAYNPILKLSRPINIIPGKRHLLAIHFVDYETIFTQREIRLKPQNLYNFINITGNDFNSDIKLKTRETHLLGSLSISVSFILFILFLLLLFLNPKQKIFKLTSVLNLTVFLAAVGTYYVLIFNTSYSTYKTIFLVTGGFSLPVMHALTLLITEWVLKKKFSLISISILIFMPITSALGHIFNISWPFGIVEVLLLSYFSYLVLSSWKTMKRTEWTVVMAMVTLTLRSLIWIITHKFFLEEFYDIENLIKTIVLLSAPTLLLVYVSLSYKQILTEREQEARKVIRITEEKKLLLEQQNENLETQVAQRTHELEKSLAELKATQSQLIQSEKMASLGELTAGIAHEIQNPLNFVNNFSEVSEELLVELKEELDKGDINEAKVISDDVIGNLSKISHHGKRADAIVKGMLQHSRSSSGQKEPTYINALAEEYLRLAYHGLRAKDKSFNATLKTDFDKSIDTINAVPQDLGRVVLNLITNAFYAVSERKKHEGKNYEPLVLVTTKKENGIIEIRVKDNGMGIPESLKEKIFQPFFTTKPTGEGTGLGLSLSYEIIKAHEGELKVDTKEGEGTEFIIIMKE